MRFTAKLGAVPDFVSEMDLPLPFLSGGRDLNRGFLSICNSSGRRGFAFPPSDQSAVGSMRLRQAGACAAGVKQDNFTLILHASLRVWIS